MPHPFVDMASAILPILGAPSAITVHRTAAGSWDGSTGNFTRGATTVIAMDAVVQPSGREQIDKLPENERGREIISVWTRAALLASSVANQRAADHVVWSGKTYEVLSVEDWAAQAQYSLSVCARVGV